MKHTPEPWNFREDRGHFLIEAENAKHYQLTGIETGPKYNGSGEKFGPKVFVSPEEAKAIAARITLCVNVCKDIEDEQLQIILDADETFKVCYERLKAQNEELLLALAPFAALKQDHQSGFTLDRPVFGINSATITYGDLVKAFEVSSKQSLYHKTKSVAVDLPEAFEVGPREQLHFGKWEGRETAVWHTDPNGLLWSGFMFQKMKPKEVYDICASTIKDLEKQNGL